MIRRKDFDELKITSAQREKDLKDKFDRVTATNSRLKANNERLQSELSEMKEDNRLLTEKMNAVLRRVSESMNLHFLFPPSQHYFETPF